MAQHVHATPFIAHQSQKSLKKYVILFFQSHGINQFTKMNFLLVLCRDTPFISRDFSLQYLEP